MDVRLQQKSLTLNDLESQFTVWVVSVIRIVTKRLRLESRYKVALYLACLHIKFDNEVKKNPFEFQT